MKLNNQNLVIELDNDEFDEAVEVLYRRGYRASDAAAMAAEWELSLPVAREICAHFPD